MSLALGGTLVAVTPGCGGGEPELPPVQARDGPAASAERPSGPANSPPKSRVPKASEK